ncbi:hypothetical protein [Nostoc sp.]|uniref:hypothetical protein n=1 Tax=Nostoc sp. TaxID=1180 RepID=UPI002FEE7CF1
MGLSDFKEMDAQIRELGDKERVFFNQIFEVKRKYNSVRLSKYELIAKRTEKASKEHSDALDSIAEIKSIMDKEFMEEYELLTK